MTTKSHSKSDCQFCGKSFRSADLFPLAMVRPNILELIQKEKNDLAADGFICHADLNHFRTLYVEQLLVSERGELGSLEHDVLESLREHEIVSANVDVDRPEGTTLGDRLSDKLASFGGSWRFLIIFASVMAVWIIVNSLVILYRPFDPFPYILLNLMLSCLAAIQAPVIMMSQNRQETKDRLRAENDYRINLKAELEIRQLHSKIDLLLTHQWQRLLEIQEIQLEVMQQISRGGTKPQM